jgi:hypothetical protein
MVVARIGSTLTIAVAGWCDCNSSVSRALSSSTHPFGSSAATARRSGVFQPRNRSTWPRARAGLGSPKAKRTHNSWAALRWRKDKTEKLMPPRILLERRRSDRRRRSGPSKAKTVHSPSRLRILRCDLRDTGCSSRAFDDCGPRPVRQATWRASHDSTTELRIEGAVGIDVNRP